MEDSYYFVWVLDRYGDVRPQIWSSDQFDRPEWQLQHLLIKRLLDAAERGMRLDRLATIYPPPEGREPRIP